jgi:hypothetical protein
MLITVVADKQHAHEAAACKCSILRHSPDATVLHFAPEFGPAEFSVNAKSWGAYCLAMKPIAMLTAMDTHPNEPFVYCVDSDLFFLQPPEAVPFGSDLDMLVTPGPGVTLASSQHPMVNSGFVGARNSARGRALLDWWQTRCKDCSTWMGPTSPEGYLERAMHELDGVGMCEHPGVNLARWNKQGEITLEEGVPYYKGVPIICFHCQAFDRRCENKTGGPISPDVVDVIYPLYERLLAETA